MGHEPHLARLYPFNENTVSSTHPWSSVIVGRTFGECDLKKFISLNDYLNSPPVMESVLRGVIQGEIKLAEEIERQRQRELAKQQHLIPKLPHE